MTFFLVLLWIAILVPEVTSVCPNLANTNGTTTVKVVFGYDSMYDRGCKINIEGFPEANIPKGETRSLPGVFNGCLKFKCNPASYNLDFVKDASACAYGSGCSKEVKSGSSCSQKYTCNNAIYDKSSPYSISQSDWYYGLSFKVFSGYTCGNTGSGGCANNQCFNPFADPTKESCMNVGEAVVNGNDVYQCQELTACGSDTYVDLVGSRGCDNNGTFVPEGTVISSDACYHTVCVVDSSGKGTFQTSFKDYEGCVHRDQCVAVGDTLTDAVLQYTCASLTCRKDTSRESPFYFDIVETGCYYNNSCTPKWKKVPLDGCEKLACRIKATTGKYVWGKIYSGCYDPATNTCSHSDGEEYYLDGCIRNKCDASLSGKWNTWYKNFGSCVPEKKKCDTDGGIPGCYHNGACHPVKTVIKMDNCTQYVCYSENRDLNHGVYKAGTDRPKWKARATGCYGPTGCMKLGEQYVDPKTLNTYRCDYNLAGLGVKYAKFHKACVAPNGTTLALGKSVFIDPIWYSCYRWGKMKNPIDTSIQFVPVPNKRGKTHTCGYNPDTGKTLYTREYFYTPYGRCVRRNYFCKLVCKYFDEPCTDIDVTPFRYIGDKFNLDGAECVCTQDRKINNRVNANPLSKFYTPSLCGEPGVTNGACADPDDGSVHQWGEFWTRPGSDPLELCTCHPLDRKTFCSDFLPDVLAVLKDTTAR